MAWSAAAASASETKPQAIAMPIPACFVQRTARGFEAQSGVSGCRAEGFRQVQTDTAHRAPNLRGQVAVATADGKNDRADQLYDVEDVIEDFFSELRCACPSLARLP
jgi:hypothetical protein